MWDNEESDTFEEADRRIDTVLEEIYSGSINWLFDLRNNLLRPLYKIDIRDKELIVTFDLPGVKKEDISISATERSLSIEASTTKPIRLMVGGHIQKHVEFERYAETIQLPAKIIPDKAKSSIRDGRLRIRIPLAAQGRLVKVR
jgi:HSP20 family molecular chaperone IbpA